MFRPWKTQLLCMNYALALKMIESIVFILWKVWNFQIIVLLVRSSVAFKCIEQKISAVFLLFVWRDFHFIFRARHAISSLVWMFSGIWYVVNSNCGHASKLWYRSGRVLIHSQDWKYHVNPDKAHCSVKSTSYRPCWRVLWPLESVQDSETYRALESKNSHKFQSIILQRVLYLIQLNFARSLASCCIRFYNFFKYIWQYHL